MPPPPQPTDPQREQLRRQAIQRRQAVIDRVAGTRTLLIGGVAVASCILAGYLDTSAQTRTASSSVTGSSGYSVSSRGTSSYDSSGQGAFGGGPAPSASLGGGTAVSGGS